MISPGPVRFAWNSVEEQKLFRLYETPGRVTRGETMEVDTVSEPCDHKHQRGNLFPAAEL